jgi:ABC-type multidrug transport system ATPase subunit
MLHQPSVLLLDEPFTGLDSQGTEQLKAALIKQKGQGKLIIVVTHNMEAIAEVTDRTLVLDRGKITYDQTGAAMSYKHMVEIYKEHSSHA